jgi:Ca2+-binding RTX toxin-like protein
LTGASTPAYSNYYQWSGWYESKGWWGWSGWEFHDTSYWQFYGANSTYVNNNGSVSGTSDWQAVNTALQAGGVNIVQSRSNNGNPTYVSLETPDWWDPRGVYGTPEFVDGWYYPNGTVYIKVDSNGGYYAVLNNTAWDGRVNAGAAANINGVTASAVGMETFAGAVAADNVKFFSDSGGNYTDEQSTYTSNKFVVNDSETSMLTITSAQADNAMGLIGINKGFYIVGSAGDGTIEGSGNSDFIQASDATGTVLIAGFGADTLKGGSQNDTLYAAEGASLDGAGGNDLYIIGESGMAVSISDSSGSGDTLSVNAGLSGFDMSAASVSGIDVLSYSGRLAIAGNTATQMTTIYGSSGSDVVVLTSAASGAVGANFVGVESVYGSSGNDTLQAGTGTVYLEGSTGSDLYIISSGSTVIFDNDTSTSSFDTVQLSGSSSYDLSNWDFTNSGLEYIQISGITTVGQSLPNTITIVGSSGEDALVIAPVATTPTLVSAFGDALIGIESLIGTNESGTITGADTLYATRVNYLDAGTGNDIVYINDSMSGSITVKGGEGSDTLVFLGPDSLTGGNWTDADFANVSGFEFISLGDSVSTSLELGANAANAFNSLVVKGGSGNEVIDARAFTEALTINANDGNDTIYGSAYADALNGGAGNDLYLLSSIPGSLTDASGTDTVSLLADLNLTGMGNNLSSIESLDIGAHSVTLTGTQEAYFTSIVGTAGSAVHLSTANTGVAGNNYSGVSSIYGSTSADVIQSSGVNAIYIDGDGGNDSLMGSSLADTIKGGSNNDTLVGNGGNDIFTDAGNGTDVIQAGDGNDLIQLMGDNQTSIDGGNNTDTIEIATNGLTFSDANDNQIQGVEVIKFGFGANINFDNQSEGIYYVLANASTTLMSGSGADTIDASAGTDTAISDKIDGGSGHDYIVGSAGGDSIVGGLGNDTILAGLGNDTLVGGADDSLLGGDGNDLFIVASGSTGFKVSDTNGSDTLSVGGSVDLTHADLSGIEYLIVDGSVSLTGAQANAFTSILGASGSTDDLVKLTSSVNGAVGGNLSGVESLIGSGEGVEILISANVNAMYIDPPLPSQQSLVGGASYADTLVAGDNQDTIVGGTNDSMLGGGGGDLYVISAGSTGFTITDDSGTDTLSVGGSLSLAGLTLSGLDVLVFDGTVSMTGDQAAAFTSVVGVNGASDIVYLTSSSTSAVGANFSEVESIIGTSGADRVASSGVNAIYVDGQGDADSLVGSTGNDTLIGGAGNDTLVGGAGDSLVGGADNDLYVIDSASAVVVETSTTVNGYDTVSVSGLDLSSFNALSNIEYLIVDGAVSLLSSQAAGFTSIIGASGSTDDAVYLVEGDRYPVGENLSGIESLFGGGWADILTATNVHYINGMGGDDSIVGNAATADLLIGLDANDTLIGQSNDTLDAGANSDWVIIANGSTGFSATGDGLDTLSVGGAINLTGAETGFGYMVTDGSVSLTGTQANEFTTIYGATGSTDDVVYLTASVSGAVGGNFSGIESLFGTSGNDVLNSVDYINAGEGNDTIYSSLGADTLIGGNGDNVYIISDATNDHPLGEIITGGTGSDVIRYTSTTATQTLFLTSGVSGGSSGDTLISVMISDASGLTTGTTAVNVNAENLSINRSVSIVGNDGNNVLTANNDGMSTLSGQGGNDTLIGGTYADYLIGGADVDTLFGSSGSDTLWGGAGVDTLTGGDGADADFFVISDEVSRDLVTDFYSATDKLVLDTFTSLSVSGATIDGSIGADVASFGAATIAANNYFSGADEGVFVAYDTVGEVTYVLVDGDTDGDFDYAVELSGHVTMQGTNFTTATGQTISLAAEVASSDAISAFAISGSSLSFNLAGGLTGGSLNYVREGTQVVITPGVVSATGGSITLVAKTTGSGNYELGFLQAQPSGGNTRYLVPDLTSFYVTDEAGSNATDLNTVINDLTATEQTNLTTLYTFGFGGDDTITGLTGKMNYIDAGLDNDSVVGSSAADTLLGDAGLDTLKGGGGADFIYGGADADRLEGEDGNDYLEGNDGADLIYGGANNDTILGGADNDTLAGQGGTNYLTGGTGADVFLFGTDSGSVDYITDWGDGSDVLSGTLGSGSSLYVTMSGSSFDASVIAATNGVVYVTGSANNDTIKGGAGADTLLGGVGADWLNGDSGIDTYIINPLDSTSVAGSGMDTISFTDGDKISFEGFTYDVRRSGVYNDSTIAGAGVYAEINANGVVTGFEEYNGTTHTALDSGTSLLVDTLAERLDAFSRTLLDGQTVKFDFGGSNYLFVQNASSDVVIQLVGTFNGFSTTSSVLTLLPPT